MADIVNLRAVRKARKRDAAARAADANRAAHGRTKGEKLRQEQEASRATRRLEGHRREND